MKRSFCLALLMMAWGVTTAFSQEAGARFSTVKGQVEVRPDTNRKGWNLANLQTLLQVMDHIKTCEDASAILTFEDRSTFILKPETEIILETPPERDSKIQLLAGKIWVNVKQIVQDGSMEVDMNQAVCGIKGTNITCGSRQGEDRVQVFRGTAEVAVRGSGARFSIQEGEELVIRPGGRTERNNIDIKTESEKWKTELTQLGSSINLNAVPGLLWNMKQRDGETFNELSSKFQFLNGQQSSPEAEVQDFRKRAERFQGVLMEDSFILNSLYTRLASAGGGNQNQGAATLLKAVWDTSAVIQGYSIEVARFLKAIGSQKENPESRKIWLEISQIWNEVQEYVKDKSREIGLSQEYYKKMVERLSKAQLRIGDKSKQLESIVSKNPSDRYTSRLIKLAGEYQKAIGRAIRNYSVVEIPQAAMREMQQIDDEMQQIMRYLTTQVENYNLAARNNQARLTNSVVIVSHFSRARHEYYSALRLYNSIMRHVTVIVTYEQQLFKDTFDHITDTYQELGVVADQIETRLEELENQVKDKFRK